MFSMKTSSKNISKLSVARNGIRTHNHLIRKQTLNTESLDSLGNILQLTFLNFLARLFKFDFHVVNWVLFFSSKC